MSNRLTSSADWAMKNPWVLDDILAPRGLMEILESSPSSDFSSMASKSNLSFVKHSLFRSNVFQYSRGENIR